MGYEQKFKVWRGTSEGGDFTDYDVEVNEGEVVLDVVHRLQATVAPDPHVEVVTHLVSSKSVLRSSGICGNGLRSRRTAPRCSVSTRLTLPQSGSVAG